MKTDNPNNCSTCGHREHGDGGWCYMFRREPDFVCAQHTAKNEGMRSHGFHIENGKVVFYD